MIKLSKEKPYEDACKILGLRPVANYKSYKLTDETRNFIKLETVAKALNEGWKPTTIDPKEVRYYVWGWNYTDNRKPSGLLYVASCRCAQLCFCLCRYFLGIQRRGYSKRICKNV